jgi:hypothetical protein
MRMLDCDSVDFPMIGSQPIRAEKRVDISKQTHARFDYAFDLCEDNQYAVSSAFNTSSAGFGCPVDSKRPHGD